MATGNKQLARAAFSLMTGLFMISGIAHGRVSEFAYEEPRAGFESNERNSQKLAKVYEDIVLGVPEKSRVKATQLPASNDVIGLEVVVYSSQFGEYAGFERGNIAEQTAAPWWSMILITAGLVFYQLRRPVRPRIGNL